MSIGLDGRVFEERTPTPLGSTGSIPEGTLITVPSAPPVGKITDSPRIVAVNTTSKWKDPVFLLTAITSLATTYTAVMDLIPSAGDINWRLTIPKMVFAILNGIAAFLRTQINSVTS